MKAPFLNENLMHHPRECGYTMPGVEWSEVEPFEADLTFDGFRRGRSAAYFMWRDEYGHEFPMFMKDLSDLLTRNVVQYGRVLDATWRVVKRGQNYGIRLEDE